MDGPAAAAIGASLATLLMAAVTWRLGNATRRSADKTADMAARTLSMSQATNRMADETSRMAAATEELLRLEQARRSAETRASVLPLFWESRDRPEKGLVVVNNGAANAEEVYAEWRMGGQHHRSEIWPTLLAGARHGFARDFASGVTLAAVPLWVETMEDSGIAARCVWMNEDESEGQSDWRPIGRY